MVSFAVAIFMFFQTKALISYSLFLSRDAGEDEALVSALNLEARTPAAAVLGCWGRTGSIRHGGWAASEVRGQRGHSNPSAPPLGPRQGKVVVGRGRPSWLRHRAWKMGRLVEHRGNGEFLFWLSCLPFWSYSPHMSCSSSPLTTK